MKTADELIELQTEAFNRMDALGQTINRARENASQCEWAIREQSYWQGYVDAIQVALKKPEEE